MIALLLLLLVSCSSQQDMNACRAFCEGNGVHYNGTATYPGGLICTCKIQASDMIAVEKESHNGKEKSQRNP